MSTAPHDGRLLALEEFFALGEEFPYRHAELQEGVLIMNAVPVSLHQRVCGQLREQLNAQLPPEWEAVVETNAVLEPEFPPTVREPDLIITKTALVDAETLWFEPKDILLAVEVISPGSKRVDRVLKPVEYAEAGIRHYWVIDLEPPLSLAAYHLADAFEAYQEAPAVTGEFVTREPFPLRVDLDRLARR